MRHVYCSEGSGAKADGGDKEAAREGEEPNRRSKTSVPPAEASNAAAEGGEGGRVGRLNIMGGVGRAELCCCLCCCSGCQNEKAM